jgi:signal peptidase I
VLKGGECTFMRAITIPPDHWFMLGDNRGASDDSRFWGPVPTRAIIGRVDDCGFMDIHCSPR